MVAKSGNGWKLAPSLVDLIDEVDARWPKRKRSSDGSIGDQSHAARGSEHNPDRDSDPMPRGYVSAVDITKDSAAQMTELRLKLVKDPRTWYVIHNRTIWSRTYNFAARDYAGSNPHTAHMHVSLMQTAGGAKAGAWGVKAKAPKPKPKPKPTAEHRAGSRTISEGDRGTDVALLQRFLGVRPDDGVFDADLTAEVKAYQRMRGLDADGYVGPLTWAPIVKALGIK